MKALIFLALLSGLASEVYGEGPVVGAPVNDFTLSNLDGSAVNFHLSSGQPTVVIFFSTHCPMSNAFNYRRNVLYHDFADRVRFIVIDSNANESLEQIRGYTRALEFDSPVYKDMNHAVADRLGARVTTDTFVIDSSGVMRYHGYLEDSPNPTRSRIQGLRLAIEAVLQGKPVEMPDTKALGCSIWRLTSARAAGPGSTPQ
jgi:hypothetical protein